MKFIRICTLFLLLFLLTGCSLGEETVTVYCVDTGAYVPVDGSEPYYLTYEYDKNGRLLYYNNGHEPKSYTYDLRGNVQSCTYYTTDGRPYYIDSFTYDANNNKLCQQRDDIAGNPLVSYHYTYDRLGHVLTYLQCNPYGDIRERTVYQYDNRGNQIVQKEYDENDKITWHIESVYDEHNNCIKETSYDPNGQIKYTYTMTYDTSGCLLTKTHSNGTSTAYTYDEAGRTAQICHYRHGSLEKTQIYTYDPQGRLQEEHTVYPPDVTIPVSATLRIVYTYDNAGNKLSETVTRHLSEYDTRSPTYTNTWTYDAYGNMLSYHDTGLNNNNLRYEYTYKAFIVPTSQAKRIIAEQSRLRYPADYSIDLGDTNAFVNYPLSAFSY